MSIQKPPRVENFEDLNRYFQDWYNNFGADDLKPSGIRTEAPTTETLGKGRQVVVELSGVPYIYYTTLAGVLYRIALTAA